MKVIIAFCFVLLCAACQSDPFQGSSIEEENSYFDVEPQLWEYFERFETEAKLRGYFIDLNSLQISGEIKNIQDENVAGTCQYGSHVKHVTIDASFWNRYNYLEREFVVFHELGHCVLGRGHTETSFNSGICTSLMHSGLSGCQVAYTNTNRTYYLDELFQNI